MCVCVGGGVLAEKASQFSLASWISRIRSHQDVVVGGGGGSWGGGEETDTVIIQPLDISLSLSNHHQQQVALSRLS